jgi:peptide/nickel transport system ATP-binding protein
LAERDEGPVLAVRGLSTHFHLERGTVKAVDGVDLTVWGGEILGLVGESGCGKSMLARSILRLVPPPGRIAGGEIRLDGQDLLALDEAALRRVRGDAIAMVFQEPMRSLNPVFTVGDQIAEILQAHRPELGRAERRARTLDLLRQVGIPSPERRRLQYPHELSGGMRQRVMIAMALACGRPRLLIADEPTTALDVTIQAQILDLFVRLQQEIGMAVLLITHDLGVVAETAHRVAVMYAGSIVEEADVDTLFRGPKHPYTQGLLRSLPRRGTRARKSRLPAIAGVVPSPLDLPAGCKFYDRCPHADQDICLGEEPVLEAIAPGHRVRCRRWREITHEGAVT